MTKVLVEGFGWVYIVIVLDWYTKAVVGTTLGFDARLSNGWRLICATVIGDNDFPSDVMRAQGSRCLCDTSF